MSDYPEVKLVDARSSSANVLFDFNNAALTPNRMVDVESGPFSHGSTEPLGELDAIHSLYADRELSFRFSVEGTKPQAAALLSSLARRMDAFTGWLYYRQTATSQRQYYKIYRPHSGPVSLDRILSDSPTSLEWWSVDLTFPASPFWSGELVTQDAQTVNNNPAHATNPCRIILPAITGDAPTPLKIAATPSATQTGARWMIALSSAPTQATPVLVQIGSGDGHETDTDTTGTVASAALSGSSGRTTTFANNGLIINRVSGTVSLTPGRWKMLTRVRFTASGQQITLRGTVAGAPATPVTIESSASSQIGWVDLGDFSAPLRADPLSTASYSAGFNLGARRMAGTGNLDWDAVLFVPAHNDQRGRSSSALFTGLGTLTTGMYPAIWDATGDDETFWATGFNTTVTELSGRFPVATPGNAHVLTLLQTVEPVDVIDSLTASTSVVVSYYPQYRWMGDS